MHALSAKFRLRLVTAPRELEGELMPKKSRTHRKVFTALTTVFVAVAAWMVPATTSGAVSGAGFTTVNGGNHCKNGNPGVNCNIYDAKDAVWLNGGPANNGLSPDGQYFFAVLAPGAQPNPN